MREQQQPTTTTTATTTTTTTATTEQLCHYMGTKAEDQERKELRARYECEAIREQYMSCIGRPMPLSIHRKLLLDLIDGAHYEYYRYALEEASLAPQPSWRYVMAIIRRLERERVPPADLIEI